MTRSLIIVPWILLALCGDALACDGCRLQSSPSFRYALPGMLAGVLYLGLVGSALLRRLITTKTHRHGGRILIGQGSLLAVISLAGFLLTFLTESSLITLESARLVTLEQVNLFYQPLVWMGLIPMVAVGITVARLISASWKFGDPGPRRLVFALSGGGWILHPCTGPASFFFILNLAPFTVGP